MNAYFEFNYLNQLFALILVLQQMAAELATVFLMARLWRFGAMKVTRWLVNRFYVVCREDGVVMSQNARVRIVDCLL